MMAGPLSSEITADGTFERQQYAIRDRITADGSSGFRAEPLSFVCVIGLSVGASQHHC